MNSNLFWLIIAMAVVTYLPRLLPMVLFRANKLPAFLERFLFFVPYAVLNALIFPKILYSTNNVTSAITGGVISLLLAYYEVNLFLTVLGGIFGVFIIQLLL